MRYLTVAEVLELHQRLIRQSGGSHGVRDLEGLESAVGQPHQTFGGEELYPSLAEKAAAIGFALIQNHSFIDGNKRVGHAALEMTLLLNGYELVANVDEQERIILGVASGAITRDQLTSWVKAHMHRVA